MHQDPVESPKRSTKQMSLWELHRISLKKFWQNIRKSRKSSFIHSGKCNWKWAVTDMWKNHFATLLNKSKNSENSNF